MGTLQIERAGDGVWTLVLDNPGKRNAVDPDMLQAIDRACDEATSSGVRCLVLVGAGEARRAKPTAFCAGYDLTALQEVPADDPLPDAVLHRAVASLERAGPPVIAAIEGAAYGAGGELAAACDLRIGSEAAVFAMPPARLGIVYAHAGLQRFVELVGLSRAKRLFYTGEAVDAARALAIGLLDEVVPPGQALARARELAGTIAANAPLAVQGMKRLFALMRRRELPPDDVAEAEALRRASFGSEDVREGIAAFLEKRPPRFTGR